MSFPTILIVERTGSDTIMEEVLVYQYTESLTRDIFARAFDCESFEQAGDVPGLQADIDTMIEILDRKDQYILDPLLLSTEDEIVGDFCPNGTYFFYIRDIHTSL